MKVLVLFCALWRACWAERNEFVWISDVHLDVIYDSKISAESYCRNNSVIDLAYKAIQKHLEKPSYGSPDSGSKGRHALLGHPLRVTHNGLVSLMDAFHGRYGCDSPPSLVWAGLQSIRDAVLARGRETPYKWMLITGDLGAHYWTQETAKLRYPSLVAATAIILNLLRKDFAPPESIPDMSNATSFLTGLNFNAFNVSEFRERAEQYAAAIKEYPLILPQIIYCPGNNDFIPDYNPEVNSDWNKMLFDLWKDFGFPADQKKTILKGAYYETSLNSEPGVSVICLNTVWWSKAKEWRDKDGNLTNSAPEDPADQFAWLEERLKAARERKGKALIVGHIPPSFSLYWVEGFVVEQELREPYDIRYHSLIEKYADVVAGQYFGHMHTDGIRIQRSSANHTWDKALEGRPVTEVKDFWRPVQSYDTKYRLHGHKKKRDAENAIFGMIFLTPAISPNHGNNPGWRRGVYLNGTERAANEAAYHLVDMVQYFSPLYGELNHERKSLGTFDNSSLITFREEYSLAEFYGVKRLEPIAIQKSFQKISMSSMRIRQMWQMQWVQGDVPPSFLFDCIVWAQSQSDMEECLAAQVRDLKANSHDNEVFLAQY